MKANEKKVLTMFMIGIAATVTVKLAVKHIPQVRRVLV